MAKVEKKAKPGRPAKEPGEKFLQVTVYLPPTLREAIDQEHRKRLTAAARSGDSEAVLRVAKLSGLLVVLLEEKLGISKG